MKMRVKVMDSKGLLYKEEREIVRGYIKTGADGKQPMYSWWAHKMFGFIHYISSILIMIVAILGNLTYRK